MDLCDIKLVMWPQPKTQNCYNGQISLAVLQAQNEKENII